MSVCLKSYEPLLLEDALLKNSSKLLVIILVLLTSACASRVPLPNLSSPNATSAKAAWAKVLQQHVNDLGQVDFAAIAKQPNDLEEWINYVTQISPRSDPQLFPTQNDQLAYYIDAYNGLAMYGVIHSGVLPEQKLRFFVLRKYPIGGEEMSLYSFENDIIRALGDPRVHFALNCMSISCPRLPQIPWDANKLDEQLNSAAIEFFNSDKHVRIDAAKRIAHLSEILDFFPEDFLAVAPSLIDYVNRYRQEPIPADYRIELIPYDWGLNKQVQ